jgi:cell division protein FtsB
VIKLWITDRSPSTKIYELPFLDKYLRGKSLTTNNILDKQKQQIDKLTFYLYLLVLKRENDELQKRITELEAKVNK